MKKTEQPKRVPGVAAITFRTRVWQMGNNTAIQLSPEIIEKLGSGRRPLVRMTIKNHTYRSAVAVMDGMFLVSLSAENRQAAGVKGGEDVDVTIALDTEPRTVEAPPDLKAALVKAKALDAFNATAPSMQREYVRQVEEAKAQETRERRIAKIVEKLSAA
jgi:hypothetical protein